MPKFVTSPRYAVDIGPHVFPTRKYGRIVERLRLEDGVTDSDLVEPEPAAEEDVLLVHDGGYYRRCRDGRLDPFEILRLELPWSPALFDASARCVRGSILAAELALEHGVGLHIGGGFHHAFADHGEGFCVFNDHAVAIRRLQVDARIARALVVDCDLHHGNGTAAIFAADPRVATFSIHEQGIYPAVKPPSDVDVGLAAGTGDGEYLGQLQRHLLPLLDRHAAQLVVYVAGADPFEGDQLGTLRLSLDGLQRRDRLVVAECERRGVPLVVVLAGGYARDFEDTVRIHLTTLREAARLWR